MSIKNTRVAIGAVVLIIVLVYFSTAIRRVSEPPAKNLREEISCITAICVIDSQYGTNCIETKPRVARIVIDDKSKRMSVHLKERCEVYE